MIETKDTIEKEIRTDINWQIGTTSEFLKYIHQKDVNIAIYERELIPMAHEINELLEQNVNFRSKGDLLTILNDVSKAFDTKKYKLILRDIKYLLFQFQQISDSSDFRLTLATVDSNMCRKFHTDINDIRMLCTYSGPGTVWLTEDNVNRDALNSCEDNGCCIVIDEKKMRQANAGDVLMLKGAIYSEDGAKAVVHRSPTIEESGEKRLLLRIDTDSTKKLWS